jgi:hypothetical protein
MMLRQILIPVLFYVSACSTSKKTTPGACDDYFKSVKVHSLRGIMHCRSIIIANGVVIRTEENNPSLLKRVDVMKCPDSYKTFGDIGANGVIVEDTKQTFDFVIPSKVNIGNSSFYNNKKKIYFLNGFLITNDSLKISKNAIKRIEVLEFKDYFETLNKSEVVLINIWILTKKELRKSLRNCRRSYN